MSYFKPLAIGVALGLVGYYVRVKYFPTGKEA